MGISKPSHEVVIDGFLGITVPWHLLSCYCGPCPKNSVPFFADQSYCANCTISFILSWNSSNHFSKVQQTDWWTFQGSPASACATAWLDPQSINEPHFRWHIAKDSGTPCWAPDTILGHWAWPYRSCYHLKQDENSRPQDRLSQLLNFSNNIVILHHIFQSPLVSFFFPSENSLCYPRSLRLARVV